ANASDTDDGAGWTSSMSAPKRAASGRTIPKNPGSPDASTHTSPSAAAMASRTALMSPPIAKPSTPSSSRWRRPPTTRRATSMPIDDRVRTSPASFTPTTTIRLGTGDHLRTLEVDEHDIDLDVGVLLARQLRPLAQQLEGRDCTARHAHLEEMPRRR